MKKKLIAAALLVMVFLSNMISVFATSNNVDYDQILGDLGLDLSVYKADLIVDTDTYNGMLDSYMNIENPAEILVRELHQSQTFMNSVVGWEAANIVLNPAELVDGQLDKKEYYEAILLKMLNASTTKNEYLEAMTSSGTKQAASLLSKWVKSLNMQQQIEINGELTGFAAKLNGLGNGIKIDDLTDEQKRVVRNELEKSEFYKENVAKGFSTAADVLSACDTLYDFSVRWAELEQLHDMSQGTIAVLDHMYANCPDDNPYLKEAIANTKYFWQENAMGAIAKTATVLTEGGKFAFDKVVGSYWSELIGSLGGGYGAYLVFLPSVAKLGTNIFVNTDKVIDSFYQMEAICAVLNQNKSSLESLRSQYRSNRTRENAEAFLSAIELYFNAYLAGCDYADKMLDSVYKDGLWSHLTNSEQDAKYNELVSSCKNIKNDYSRVMDHLLNVIWLIHLEYDHPDLFAVLNGAMSNSYSYKPVTGVKMSEDKVTWGLDSGICMVKAEVLPADATNKNVLYSSSNENVVIVDASGWCTPIGLGTAVITAVTEDGGYTAATEVTIVEHDEHEQWNTLADFEIKKIEGGIEIKKYRGSLPGVKIPDQINGQPVISIGEQAFANNLALRLVVFPDTIKEIKESAFYNCKGLASVELKNGMSFGSEAFGSCTGIKKVTVPIDLDYTQRCSMPFRSCSGIEEIEYTPGETGVAVSYSDQYGRLEWYAGKSIRTVRYQEGITDIGNYAIKVDTSGATYYSGDQPDDMDPENVYLPDTLKRIGDHAFEEKTCRITGGMDSVETIGAYAFSNFGGEIDGTLENLVTVGEKAFEGCTGIHLSALPSRMTEVGINAFYNFPGFEGKIVIKPGMSIGQYAFSNSKNISEVEIRGFEALESGAFESCTGIKKVTVPIDLDYTQGSSGPFTECSGIEEIEYTPGESGVAVSYSDQRGRLEWYAGKSIRTVRYQEGITDIGNYAIKVDTSGATYYSGDQPDDMDPENVYLPDTLKRIGDHAFEEKTSRIIGGMDSVETIGAYAFRNFGGEISGDLKCLLTVGDYAFNNCDSIKRLLITDGLTNIGNAAFSGCDNLTVFGNEGSYTGTYCNTNRISFVPIDHPDFILPESLSSIEEEGFTGLGMVYVKCPDTLKSIGNRAFSDCDNLKCIFISESTTQIAQDAFEGCSADLTVLGHKNSYAESFAEDNGFGFFSLE